MVRTGVARGDGDGRATRIGAPAAVRPATGLTTPRWVGGRVAAGGGGLAHAPAVGDRQRSAGAAAPLGAVRLVEPRAMNSLTSRPIAGGAPTVCASGSARSAVARLATPRDWSPHRRGGGLVRHPRVVQRRNIVLVDAWGHRVVWWLCGRGGLVVGGVGMVVVRVRGRVACIRVPPSGLVVRV